MGGGGSVSSSNVLSQTRRDDDIFARMASNFHSRVDLEDRPGGGVQILDSGCRV